MSLSQARLDGQPVGARVEDDACHLTLRRADVYLAEEFDVFYVGQLAADPLLLRAAGFLLRACLDVDGRDLFGQQVTLGHRGVREIGGRNVQFVVRDVLRVPQLHDGLVSLALADYRDVVDGLLCLGLNVELLSLILFFTSNLVIFISRLVRVVYCLLSETLLNKALKPGLLGGRLLNFVLTFKVLLVVVIILTRQ